MKGDAHPCGCCGRRAAYRRPGRGSNKARVRHKCPHGTWCVAGHPLGDSSHMARCAECRVYQGEYRNRGIGAWRRREDEGCPCGHKEDE